MSFRGDLPGCGDKANCERSSRIRQRSRWAWGFGPVCDASPATKIANKGAVRRGMSQQCQPTSNGKGFMTEDLLMTCNDCGQEFTFSSEDQAFFQERGYSAPKRCKTCRQAKKNEQAGGGGFHRSESQGTTVTCSACGKQTTVPFEPRGDRPVYCQDCYGARKRDSGGRGGYRSRR